MPTYRFPTTTPVSLFVEHHAGSVEVVADAAAESTVAISRHEDEILVEMTGSRLTIQPRRRHRLRHQRIDVVVHVPAGSSVEVSTAAASVTVQGPVASLEITSASASVTADEVAGPVEAQSASGSVRIRSAAGPVSFRSASGSLRVERVGGECEATTASGSITIGVADDDVSAKSVSGRVAVREAHRGTVDLSSTSGSVEVGVRRGTLAWLDVSSVGGRTTSSLSAEDDAPATGGPMLTVRARSVSGHVSVAPAGPAPIAAQATPVDSCGSWRRSSSPAAARTCGVGRARIPR